jgi:cysteine desulfurase
MRRIYLDHNATTRPAPEVVEEMLACLRDVYGNPSSLHAEGQAARALLERARARVAALIGAQPEEVVFTSGGTEADNQAVLGAAAMSVERGRHVVASAIEHQAVLNPCRHLEASGWQLTLLPVDEGGEVDLGVAQRAIGPCTALVSTMLANNDVGTLQPVRELASISRAKGALLHTSARWGSIS